MKTPDFVELVFDEMPWKKKGLLLPGKRSAEKVELGEEVAIRFSRRHRRYHLFEIAGVITATEGTEEYITELRLWKKGRG